jgi:hypothetical protein
MHDARMTELAVVLDQLSHLEGPRSHEGRVWAADLHPHGSCADVEGAVRVADADPREAALLAVRVGVPAA